MPGPLRFSCDLLVVAAFAPELETLREALGGNDGRALARGQGGSGALDIGALPVGIGLAAAAVGAARAVIDVRPRAVVLIGTCGAYDGSRLLPLDVAVSTVVTLADAAVAEGRGAYPGSMARPIEGDRELVDALAAAGGTRASVATTLSVTTEDLLASRLSAAFEASAEHLEAYAVARACEALGARFVAALGVANRVGATGRDEWRANNVEAGARAAQVVLRWIAAGAPGLRSVSKEPSLGSP